MFLRESELVKKINKRLKVLIWGTVSFLFFGMLYGWSIFVAPLEAEFGWSRVETSVAYTISLVCYTLGLFFNGLLSKKMGIRFPGFMGTAMMVVGLAGSAFINSLGALYILYGVFWGSGIGLCYNSWLVVVVAWYPEKKGLASGVLLMGVGVGGLIIGTMIGAIINTSIGWRGSLMILAALLLVEAFFALRYMHMPDTAAEESIVSQTEQSVSYSPLQMLRQPCFWSYAVWRMALCGLCQAIIGQQIMLITESGAAAFLATMTVGIVSIGNGGSRVLLGMFTDGFGYIKTLLFISVGTGIASVALLLGYTKGIPYATFAALILIGACYGGTIMISSLFVRNVFGPEHFQSNLGAASLVNIGGTMTSPLIISMMYSTYHSYKQFIILTVIVSVVSLILVAATYLFEKRIKSGSKAVNPQNFLKEGSQ